MLARAPLACLALLAGAIPGATPRPESPVPSHATGTFDVSVTHVDSVDQAEGIALGRMTLAKVFHGGIEGSSSGTMLTAMTDANKAGAYVAVERVVGTLAGRTGSFALMHQGTFTAAGQELVVTVAPGSGTGGLTGLRGSMTITITGREHRYDLAYELPGAE